MGRPLYIYTLSQYPSVQSLIWRGMIVWDVISVTSGHPNSCDQYVFGYTLSLSVSISGKKVGEVLVTVSLSCDNFEFSENPLTMLTVFISRDNSEFSENLSFISCITF